MNDFKLVLFLLVILLLVQNLHGLKCYTCSIGESDKDPEETCLVNPDKAPNPYADCDKIYCSIIRVELLEPKGKLVSFSRFCEDKPIYINEIIEDSTHRFYYRSCKTDLCNKGTGKGSNKERPSLGDKSTIYVPGTGRSDATMLSFNVFLMGFSLFWLLGSLL